jgi:cytochrome c oxidase assembly protein subunit 15
MNREHTSGTGLFSEFLQNRKRLRRFAWTVVALIFALIFLGGMVKSTNSGLAVPDWPNTYGHFMFTFPLDRMVGGVFWEHLHRMVASVIGLLTFGLTWWVWKVDRRRWVRNTALFASIAVVVQGVLGGMTVLMHLPAWTSSSHGTLAQIYLCLVMLVALAYGSDVVHQTEDQKRSSMGKSLFTLSMVTVGAIGIQLVLGAIMRHLEAGLAIPDFPTMFGSWTLPLSDEAIRQANIELARNGLLEKAHLQEVTRTHMIVHLLHRFWAVVVAILCFVTATKVMRRMKRVPGAVRTAALLIGVVIVQVSLGILTIYTEKQPTVTTLHVVTGAVTLTIAVTLAFKVRMRSRNRGRKDVPAVVAANGKEAPAADLVASHEGR